MTKEQEESIEILENLKTVIETGLVNFSGKSMYDCGYQEAIEHILSDLKNVLSMLEEKDIKLIETKEANRQLSIELKNKDKIIELMAEAMRYYNGMQQKQEFCIDICEEKECNIEKCKERIKQYFENKAKERR